jgi:hypothetical protein
MHFTKGRSAATLLAAVALAVGLPAGRAAAQCYGGQRQMGTQPMGRSLSTSQLPGTSNLLPQLQALQQQYALLTALQQQQDALAAAALQQRILAARIARLEKRLEQQQARLQQQQEKEELIAANALVQQQRKAILTASGPKPKEAAPADTTNGGK